MTSPKTWAESPTTHTTAAQRAERGEAMSVYVDQVVRWPTKIRCFSAGSCHLMADTLDELHAFAERLGMKRDWFQPHAIEPHYDLTVKRRAKAVESGAVETTTRERVLARRAQREAPKRPGAESDDG